MKRQLLLTTFMTAILSASLFAQKARIGIQGGISMSNMFAKLFDEKETSDLKQGFTAGLMIDQPIGKQFYFQPALNFVQKGSKSRDDFGTSQSTLNYIEIPLNFLYRSTPTKGFFAGVGPSVGVGISGHSKDDYGEGDIEFGNNEDEDDFKRMEFGGNLVTGYLFDNGLQISVNFNKTFSNLVIGDAADFVKIRNNYFSVRVGYLFDRKK